jgi:S-formylglutathione hydrolase
MGGLGALSIGLKNPSKYKSISAFAPISNLYETAWGKKALLHYFGSEDAEEGKIYDPVHLVKSH